MSDKPLEPVLKLRALNGDGAVVAAWELYRKLALGYCWFTLEDGVWLRVLDLRSEIVLGAAEHAARRWFSEKHPHLRVEITAGHKEV